MLTPSVTDESARRHAARAEKKWLDELGWGASPADKTRLLA